MDSSDTDTDIFPAAYRAAQQEQAKSLRQAADKAGLEFDGFLAPEAALWSLEAIEKGKFLWPSEIVAVAVQQFIEMREHPDLQQELLRRMLQKAMEDPSPRIPAEEAFASIKARITEFKQHRPARWEKVGQEHMPDNLA